MEILKAPSLGKSSSSPLSDRERRQVLEWVEDEKRFNRLVYFDAYGKQREFFTAGATKRERLFMAGNQLGKELRADCPVLTPDGWAPIAELKVGDAVIAGDGTVTEVTGVYPQGVKPLVEIEFCYGQKIIAGYEHLWRVLPPLARFRRRSETRRENGRKFTVEIPNERFGQWQVCNTRAMREKYGDTPSPKYRFATPAVGVTMLTPRDVPIDPYVIGVLLGDGCLGQGLRFTTADVEIISAVREVLAETGGELKHDGRYDFRIVRSPLFASARTLGLLGKGAADKRVPAEYMWNAPEVRLAVLQGLMDTDGTCEKSGTTSFTTISEGLADDVMFLARSFGAKCYRRLRITSYTHKGEKRRGQRSHTVVIRLPHVPLFRLKRKLDRYVRPTSTTDHNLIVAFRDAPAAEAVCISVSHPEKTYVIKDFIVTHNTEGGAFEAAVHLTGRYPKWWKGRKWDRPVRGWAAGETSLAVRDTQQKKLCGEPGVDGDFGAGMIPRECLLDKSLARGVTDAIDTIQVKHVSGGTSVLRFKSYEQGRAKFQGETLDFVWFDEEPDLSIYSEGLTRITATGGMAYMTFTPLKGMSDVVARFLNEPSEDRTVVTMTIDDALHIAPEERKRIIAGYPAHERDARAKGVPMLGSGRIFKFSEEAISEPMIDQIPPHWGKIWGIDFGIDHPFAAALLLWDRDNDVVHVHHVIRMRDALPMQHAVPMKVVGAAVPVAWPHDGNVRGDRNTGETMATLYKAQGLAMLPQHATWPDGGISTEAGITAMQDRMATGKFKAANHLSEFFEEYRLYHRKDGLIVKERDDIMSAVRIGLMMLRSARNVQLGSVAGRRTNEPQFADGIDFDPFDPHGA